MFTFKSLDELSLKEASILFNRGFEDYLLPMELSLDAFVSRFGHEVLSPELSVVMFEDDLPIGFVIQGIREVNCQRIGWNGGTGIIPEYRGKKLAVTLMEKALEVLTENQVEISTLEALSMNLPAINLYKKLGYEVIDNLYFLDSEGILYFDENLMEEFAISRIPASHAINSGLFPAIVPWQLDPSNGPRVGGEVVIAKKDDEVMAACLIRRKEQFGKELEGVTLFQAISNGQEAGQRALFAVLQEGLAFTQNIKRSTYNFQGTNTTALEFLLASGFKMTELSQVFMTKHLR